jgi:hypothetical protein
VLIGDFAIHMGDFHDMKIVPGVRLGPFEILGDEYFSDGLTTN